MLEGGAGLGLWKPQDPPQEVALDIKLSYIYKVSQASFPALPQSVGVQLRLTQKFNWVASPVTWSEPAHTAVGSVLALVPMLQKAGSPPVTASLAKGGHRTGALLVSRQPVHNPSLPLSNPSPPPNTLSLVLSPSSS